MFKAVLAGLLIAPLLACPTFAADWHAKAVFLTDQRIETLNTRIARRLEPTFSNAAALKKSADAALAYQPIVPEKYFTLSPYKYPDESAAHNKTMTFGRDSIAAYELALAYRLGAGEKYAQAAVRLINAWDTQLKSIDHKQSNTALSISCGFPAFIVAADLLKKSPSFPKDDQDRFRTFLRDKVVPCNSMDRKNNWANWGTFLVISAGAYLDDQSLFDKGVARWKQLIHSQIAPDGTLKEEVTREEGKMGLWYSHFSLLPASLCAEIARVNGQDLYAYTTPTGQNLQKAYDKLIPWVKDPSTFPYYKGNPKDLVGVYHFPYFELLTPRFPNPDALQLLHTHRPANTHFGLPDLTLTHGDLPEDK